MVLEYYFIHYFTNETGTIKLHSSSLIRFSGIKSSENRTVNYDLAQTLTINRFYSILLLRADTYIKNGL
jgi:hypothetical protein